MDLLHYPLAFIALLGVLVTFHEFGHYVVARWSGVRILQFSVGFGRALWSRVDKRGTEFKVAMIPIGGYVRMYDDRDQESQPEGSQTLELDNTKAYMDLHPGWRIAIAFGGPLANFLLAILVYWGLLVVGTSNYIPALTGAPEDSAAAKAGLVAPLQILAVDERPVSGWQDIGLALTGRLGETGTIAFTVKDLASNEERVHEVAITAWHEGVGDPDVLGSLGLEPALPSVIGEILPESPAASAGLLQGDFVVAVNGVQVQTWMEWVAQIEQFPNQRISLELYRNGILRQVPVTLSSRPSPPGIEGGTDEGAEVGTIGVYPPQVLVQHGIVAALPGAFNEAWDKTTMIFSVIKKMVTGQVSVKNLSGPISIAQVAGDSARYSWRSFIGILAFLSLSLAVMNLLPIPILDGGHILFNSAELITGKPVSERVQIVGVQVGLFLVGSMMVFATYNDLLRLF